MKLWHQLKAIIINYFLYIHNLIIPLWNAEFFETMYYISNYTSLPLPSCDAKVNSNLIIGQ